MSAPSSPETAPDALLASLGLTRERVRRAEEVVRRHFPPTPLLPAGRLSRALGVDLWLKVDALTPVRSFKLRGALTKLDALRRAGVEGGVVTASAGNHGLAVAWAARAAGRRAVVCVPRSANPQKVEAIAALGATVEPGGRDYQEAHERSIRLAEEEGLALVHAYDDADIVAGQATLAAELLAGGPFDRVLAGVGGGGLIAGVAAGLALAGSPARVVGVQPQGADSMVRSLEAGEPVVLGEVRTIADGLAARRPGDLPFAVARACAVEAVRVSDEDLRRAMALLLREERIVAEPAGAAGLAALLRHGSGWAGERVAVLVTGANLADAELARLCAEVAGI